MLQRLAPGALSFNENLQVHEVTRLRFTCEAVGGIKRKHGVEIMLIELMSRSRIDEYLPHEPVLEWVCWRLLDEMENPESAREIVAVGVMLNVGDGSIVSPSGRIAILHQPSLLCVREHITIRVAEVVGNDAECIDLQILQQILWDLVEKPINDHASLDATLRMQDQDHSFDTWFIEGLLD